MGFGYDGKWKNQLGATMTLTVHENGAVEGTFKTPVADHPGPLVGFVKRDVIVFCSVFETAAGTMLGQPLNEGDANSFDTWWLLRLFDDESESWSTVRTGCDTFTRIE